MSNSFHHCCVYALIDPRDEQTFYVGSTSDLHERLSGHNSHVCWKSFSLEYVRWRIDLAKNNLLPSVHILEKCLTKTECRKAESVWIKTGLKCRWPLTNVTGPIPRDHDKLKKELLEKFVAEMVEYRVWNLSEVKRS